MGLTQGFSQVGLTSYRRPVVRVITKSLSQHDEKHVVPTPLSWIRVGRRSGDKDSAIVFTTGRRRQPSYPNDFDLLSLAS
jgi:hypothetical protein